MVAAMLVLVIGLLALSVLGFLTNQNPLRNVVDSALGTNTSEKVVDATPSQVKDAMQALSRGVSLPIWALVLLVLVMFIVLK